jgi:hypothetical protein
MPIRAISRRLDVSQNAVRRVLAAGRSAEVLPTGEAVGGRRVRAGHPEAVGTLHVDAGVDGRAGRLDVVGHSRVMTAVMIASRQAPDLIAGHWALLRRWRGPEGVGLGQRVRRRLVAGWQAQATQEFEASPGAEVDCVPRHRAERNGSRSAGYAKGCRVADPHEPAA